MNHVGIPAPRPSDENHVVRQPLRPFDTYDVDPMIDWHERLTLWYAACGDWTRAHQHALHSARLEAIDRLIAANAALPKVALDAS